MASLSTSTNFPAVSSGPWRPHSVPVNPANLRRQLCGLLNKINHANYESVSSKIVACAAMVERTDPTLLHQVAQNILQRVLCDPSRITLYADLCQMIVGDLEEERTRWRKVDAYYLGNALHSFETSLQDLSQSQLQLLQEVDDHNALADLTSFLGSVVAYGVISMEEAGQVFDTLLDGIEHRQDEHIAAIRRFLKPIIHAAEASRTLHALSVVNRLEHVLEDVTLSFKSRFFLMDMLQKADNPAPLDAFFSMEHRAEVYGFNSPMLSMSPALTSEDIPESRDQGSEIRQIYDDRARSFFVTRGTETTGQFLHSLPPHHRHIFIACLISQAVSSNDISDAQALGAFFGLPTVDVICEEGDYLRLALREEIKMLDDVILDNPNAPRQLAILLFLTGVQPEFVEVVDHASHSGQIWRRVLDEYLSLEEIQNTSSGPEPDEDMFSNDPSEADLCESDSGHAII